MLPPLFPELYAEDGGILALGRPWGTAIRDVALDAARRARLRICEITLPCESFYSLRSFMKRLLLCDVRTLTNLLGPSLVWYPEHGC